MVEPVRPEDVTHKIPGEVVEVFNTLIGAKWDGRSAVIYQAEVVEALVAKGFDEDEIFNRRLLAIEPLFLTYGWKVVFYKPDYTQGGRAYFTVSKT